MDLYTWHTPNGKKAPILLAELGWAYELVLVDLKKDEQKHPSYLALNPNGKIPALVDGSIVVFESGAILQYLADNAGRFLPHGGAARWEVLSWLYWQVGGTGPMFGQVASFEHEENEQALEKFIEEGRRLCKVFDRKLGEGRDFIAGEYSIADIAAYPWFAAICEKEPKVVEGFALLRVWMDRMAARPAVVRGMELQPTPRRASLAIAAHAHH